MIARTMRGLGALGVVVLGLLGWPALLLSIGNGVADWLPDLADPLALLSRPDTGGLFLVIVLALAWVAWLVWSVALLVEVAAQVRGVPTPRLGGLFPQGAAAAVVTAIAVAFVSTPGIALAVPASQDAGTDTNSASAPSDPTATAGAPVPAAASMSQPEPADEVHDYFVRRGDTLWDIADEHLDDPTRYPEIVDASDEITQPDGRHLEDPDLILPGWTLHIPEPSSTTPGPEEAPDLKDDRPESVAEPVTPPATPMRPAGSFGDTFQRGDTFAAPPATPANRQAAAPASPGGGAPRGASAAIPAIPSAGGQLPSTPMRVQRVESVRVPITPVSGSMADADRADADGDTPVVGLPYWITEPLLPTQQGNAEDLVAAASAGVAARDSN